jgi:hypothetical protein
MVFTNFKKNLFNSPNNFQNNKNHCSILLHLTTYKHVKHTLSILGIIQHTLSTDCFVRILIILPTPNNQKNPKKVDFYI